MFQKMSDPPADRCPECSGSVRRLIGAGAGLLFKGSGFYITDYRTSDYKAKAAGESPGGRSGEASPPAKPDSGAAKKEKKIGSVDGGGAGSSGASSTKPEGGKQA